MKYAFISRIGQGAYGFVMKARDVETGEIVAMKQIGLKTNLQNQMDILREINALRHMKHLNVINLREVLYAATTISIVLDFIESNLKLVIYDEKRPINLDLLKHFFFQVLKGLEYIHGLSIMHRDIKPDNILISRSCRAVIADFGLAGLYLPEDRERSYSHQVATRWYRAPELLFGSVDYTPAVDMWAFGCVLVEYLNVSPLFEGANDIDQIGKVFKILGTPTKLNWPNWEATPDYGKMNFDKQEAISDWNTIGK
ncbi:unnamed protein product [Bursaphelenchus okinawaensis]|uniref:Cyclin-dependent kinase 20 n=1 Tax=Bursaphelenchus okinawaensis TaxID=465554 RepID=A0A811KVT9_9BILA|nr:unnamed protein product [Bursaphelenchus okinawaensis]CAG9112655.1 unnamed protein product [Bursaphelenchus okinawaensis]